MRHTCVEVNKANVGLSGDATYSGSSASAPFIVSLEMSSISMSVTLASPTATENATFTVALRSGGPGIPALAAKSVVLSFGDGYTATGTTDSLGHVTFMHAYATATQYALQASFAGDIPVSCCPILVNSCIFAGMLACEARQDSAINYQCAEQIS